MKKTVIIIGLIGALFYFLSSKVINYILVPIAAYNSQQVWKEHEKEIKQTSNDSIKKFPIPIGYVSDYETIFTKEQIKELTNFIDDYEQKTTREIAIVTVKSIEPYTDIANYATDLSNEWGIGKATKKNGLLILVSKNLRKVRISTGLETEKIITDSICLTVLNETIIPEFKKDAYYKGVKNGLIELIKYWK